MRVFIIGLLALSVSAAAQDPIPISLPDAVVYAAPDDVVGTQITVPVRIGSDVTGRGIRSADIEVGFDPAVVSITSAVLGDLPPDNCLIESNAVIDQIRVGLVCTVEGGPGSLIILQGTLVGEGTTALTLSDDSQFNEGDPAVTLANGSIQVVTDPDPSIGQVDDQTVPEDGTTTVEIALSDQDTSLESLVVTAQSSSQTLVADSGLAVGLCEGQDASSSCRIISITPESDASGTATITLTVSDGDDRSQDTQTSFDLVVTSVNDAPTATMELDDRELPRSEDPFEIDLDAVFSDIDDATLQYSATSSAPESATVTISGNLATVVLDQFGVTTITFTATDSGGLTAQVDFVLTVLAGVSTESGLPVSFAVRGSFPNPVVNLTDVVLDLPATSDVRVLVYDAVGRRVADAYPGVMAAGAERRVPLDLASLPAGVYVYRVTAKLGDAVESASGQLTIIR